MDPEKRKVNNKRYCDQPDCTGGEVAPEVFLKTDELVMCGRVNKH